MNKVLIVAVHPDDETLGCGGTILSHKYKGDQINWLVCTTIPKNHTTYEKRTKEIDTVISLYSFDSFHSLELDTMRVDEYSMSELISKISPIIKEVKPNIIYLPFKSDVHSDHRKIFEAAYSCTKVFRYGSIKKLYMMETLSETEFSVSTKDDSFVPNVFVNITDFIEKKCEIASVYESELAEHPFPRSIKNIKALATYRGATSGFEYAESFMLLKEIVS
jgi:N-acetylglucosamine malate deacetylase 1